MVNVNSESPGVWLDGIALVRVTVGVLLIFHGWRLFDGDSIAGLREFVSNPSISFQEAMGFTTKLVALAGGFLLILGLFTRLITALLFLTFMFMTFVAGEGSIFGDNQSPFLFALISLVFFFTGAGRLSIDHILFINRKADHTDSNLTVSKRFGRYVSKS